MDAKQIIQDVADKIIEKNGAHAYRDETKAFLNGRIDQINFMISTGKTREEILRVIYMNWNFQGQQKS